MSSGCGGFRAEYLSLLGERLNKQDMMLLEELGMAYMRGDALLVLLGGALCADCSDVQDHE